MTNDDIRGYATPSGRRALLRYPDEDAALFAELCRRAIECDAALERAVRAEAEAARLKAENDDFRLGGASIGMRAVLADMGDMHRAIVAYADARPAVGVQSPKRTAATHFALMELGKKLRGANP